MNLYLNGEILYKRSFYETLLKCLNENEIQQAMKKIHQGNSSILSYFSNRNYYLQLSQLQNITLVNIFVLLDLIVLSYYFDLFEMNDDGQDNETLMADPCVCIFIGIFKIKCFYYKVYLYIRWTHNTLFQNFKLKLRPHSCQPIHRS